MRVLAAILTQTRRVTHDVTRMRFGLIERRREEAYQLVLGIGEQGLRGIHGLPAAGVVAQPGDDRPRLRKRIDTGFGIGMRTERFSVIEEGPQIPVTIPGRAFRGRGQL